MDQQRYLNGLEQREILTGQSDKPQILEHLHAHLSQGRSELMSLLTATGMHQAALGNPLQFDYATGIPRSGEWPTLRKKVLELQPWCSVCRSTTNVQVHHMLPFHLDPTKELDTNNLIPLCEGTAGHLGQMNCHFCWGHYGNWKNYDHDVVEVVNYLRNKLDQDKLVDPQHILFPRKSI